MYKKILVPLDGSEMAETVLPHAVALARATGAEVALATVLQFTLGAAGGKLDAMRRPRRNGRRRSRPRQCSTWRRSSGI